MDDPDDAVDVTYGGLRTRVRDVVDASLAAGDFTPRCDAWMRGFDADFSRKLARCGLLGLSWPREYGGQGMSHRARLVITEELLRAGAPVAAHWVGDRQIGPAILKHGSPQLRDEFLPALARVDATFCLGMSETEAGSDLSAVRTTARRDGAVWVVTGSKIWTTNAHQVTHAYVLARTERTDDRRQGLTEFIVAMDSPGIGVRPILDMAGEHHFNEVVLDGVLVPDEHVLGQVGQGWPQVTGQLALERGGPERFLSTYPLLRALVASVGSSPNEAVAERIGGLTARLAALRSLAWQIAEANDRGAPSVVLTATLKHLGTVFERDVTENARAVVGAAGGDSAELEDLLRQAVTASPGATIRGGSSEVLLTLIHRQGPTA